MTENSALWRRTVMWAGIPLMIGALNEYALAVALPSMRDEFALAVHDLRWVMLCFLLADAVLLIAAGRYGDRVGRRRVMVIGFSIVAVGSLGAAIAPTFALFLVARIIEGIGAGFLFSGLLGIVRDAAPADKLGRAFGLWAFVGAIAVFLSPLLGGLLTQTASWRWIMAFNALLALVALVLTPKFMPVTPESERRERARTGGLIAREPLESEGFIAGTSIMMMIYATMTLIWFMLTFFLQATFDLSPLQVGAVFCSYAIWWLVLTPFTGRLVDRVGARAPLLIGLALGVLGMLMLAMSASSERLGVVVGALTLCAFGMAFAVPATNAVAFANVDPAWRGEASGINMTLRLVGSIVGLAVAGRVIASNVGSSAGAGLAHSAVTLWVLGAVLLAVAFVVAVMRVKSRAVEVTAEQ